MHVVFTPDNTHFDIALYAIRKGMHVLVAKPLVLLLSLSVSRFSLPPSLSLSHTHTHRIAHLRTGIDALSPLLRVCISLLLLTSPPFSSLVSCRSFLSLVQVKTYKEHLVLAEEAKKAGVLCGIEFHKRSSLSLCVSFTVSVSVSLLPSCFSHCC